MWHFPGHNGDTKLHVSNHRLGTLRVATGIHTNILYPKASPASLGDLDGHCCPAGHIHIHYCGIAMIKNKRPASGTGQGRTAVSIENICANSKVGCSRCIKGGERGEQHCRPHKACSLDLQQQPVLSTMAVARRYLTACLTARMHLTVIGKKHALPWQRSALGWGGWS